MCLCLTLSLAVRVCACITVDNVAVVVSPVTLHTARAESHAAFRMPFLRRVCTHLVSPCLASHCALFSHEIPLRFFYFCIILFMFRTRGFFFARLQLPYPLSRCPCIPVCRVSARSHVIFFSGTGKGFKLGYSKRVWVRVSVREWVRLPMCVCVCLRVSSLKFHVKRILKQHRFASFRFAFLCTPHTFHIHSYFHFVSSALSTLSCSLCEWAWVGFVCVLKSFTAKFLPRLLAMARWCKNNLKLFSNIFCISFHTLFFFLLSSF